jgi:hypothetical protein
MIIYPTNDYDKFVKGFLIPSLHVAYYLDGHVDTHNRTIIQEQMWASFSRKS